MGSGIAQVVGQADKIQQLQRLCAGTGVNPQLLEFVIGEYTL
jgi:hypothetical protein